MISKLKKYDSIRKGLASFLIFFLAINFLPVSAAARYAEFEIKQVVFSNINKISSTVGGQLDQRGLISSLENILLSSLWIDYMHDNDLVEFEDAEKKHYYGLLVQKVSDFNSRYVENDKYISVIIDSMDINSFSSSRVDKMISDVADYCTKIYDQHKVKIDAETDENGKSKYYSDNAVILDAVYRLLQRFQQDYSFMRGLIPYADQTSTYSVDSSPINKILNNTGYSDLFNGAIKSLENSISSGYVMELTDTDDLLGKFITVDNGKEVVNKAYLAALSASSLYIPMKSIVGDSHVGEALTFLSDGDTSVLDAYNSLAFLKKPLYLTEFDGKKSEGSATKVTLGDLITSIRDSKTGALVTVRGKFTVSEDGDSYNMSQTDVLNRIDSHDGIGNYEEYDKERNKDKDKDKDKDADKDKDKDADKDKDKDKDEDEDVKEDSTLSSETLEYGNKTISLDTTITDYSVLTSPILVFGKVGKGATNTLVLNNAFSEKNNLVDLDSELFRSSTLYVNPFGDIILADNTVVLPAAANATFYSNNKDVIYNPFTEIFMDNYPKIRKQEEFNVNKNDEDKLLAAVEKEGFNIGWTNNLSSTLNGGILENIHAYYIGGKNKLRNSTTKSFHPLAIDTGMIDPKTGNKLQIFVPQEKDYKGFFNFQELVMSDKLVYVLDESTIIGEGLTVPIFPYTNSTGDEAKFRAKFLVKSFYSSLVLTDDGESEFGNGRLDTSYLYDMYIEVFNGKSNVGGFEKYVKAGLLEEESQGLFYSLVKGIREFCKTIVDLFGDAPGMLGIRSANQDPIMGQFLYYSKLFMPYIFLVLALVFMASYTRQKTNFTYTLVGIGISLFVAFIGIYFLPKHISTITNFFPGNFSNQIGLQSLQMRQEVMLNTNTITPTYSDFGRFGFSQSSINLYKLSDNQLEDICKDYGVDFGKIVSGGTIVLDDESGFYIEGDTMKINLDRMLNNLSIFGTVQTVSSQATYSLEVKRNVSSVLDYYTPYYLFVDGLVEKLNILSRIYEIPRSQLPYSGGIRKDNFLMSSYVHSPVFLTPDSILDSNPEMSDTLYQQLIDESWGFGENNSDFLGISKQLKKVYSSPESDALRNSLWFMTMEQNGYFKANDKLSTKKYNHLIEYVNLQVKKFLLDNEDSLPYISDENLIEVTALYALMVFNNEVSEFNNVLYPQQLNYEELSITDIFRPVLTKDYNKFSSLDRDLLDYAYYEFNWVGVVGVTICVVFACLVSLIVNYGVYVLYILLIVFCIIRFILLKKVSDAFLGFVKIYGVLIVVYFIYVFGTLMISNFGSSGLSIIFLLILYSICLGLSVGVMSFVISGFNTLDFGSTKVDSYIKGMSGKFGFGNKVNNMNVNNATFDNSRNTVIDTDYEDDGIDFSHDRFSSFKDISLDNDMIDSFMRSKYGNKDKKEERSSAKSLKRRMYRNVSNLDLDDDELL